MSAFPCPHGQVALVTGASSGIGLAIAQLLTEQGLRVYGVNRSGRLPEGADPGFTLLPCDVTDDQSAETVVDQVLEKEGRIDILINAAGNGICGAAEDCTVADTETQMAVNFYGAMRMTRLVLPGMRARRQGIILNIGSVGGIFAIPFQTLYSSSKAALAIWTEGLRLELKPYGVKAALVEPGDVKTGFTAARRYAAAATEQSDYAAVMQAAVGRMEQDEQNGMPPAEVAKAVWKVLKRKHPPARRVVGASYRAFVFLKRLLPAALTEKLLYSMYCRTK